jgi:hypothetical protein
MWLKLLFVPLLGVVILSLFLLEECCCWGVGENESNAAQFHALVLAQQTQQKALQNAELQMKAILQGKNLDKNGSISTGATTLNSNTSRKGSRALLVDPSPSSNAGGGTSRKGSSAGGIISPISPLLTNNTNNTNNNTSNLLYPQAGLSNSHSTNSDQQSYPYPLTLLSLARTPEPSIDYPLNLNVVDTTPPLCNPQDLLAGSCRATRLAATMSGSAAALGAQTLLLGTPALLPSTPSATWPQALRVNIINEAGISTIVTVPSPNITIRELCIFYTQKNNINLTVGGNATATLASSSSSSAIQGSVSGSTGSFTLSNSLFQFSYKGKLINSDRTTLTSIGFDTDCDIIHISLDYQTLYRTLRNEMAREIHILSRRTRISTKNRNNEENKWKLKMEQLENIEKNLKTTQLLVDQVSEEKLNIQQSIDTLKLNISNETNEISRLSKAKSIAEGSDIDRIEMKRYEKLKHTLSKEYTTLEHEMNELVEKSRKVEVEKNSIHNEIKNLNEKSYQMEDEISTLAYLAPIESFNSPEAAAIASSTSAPIGFQPISILNIQVEKLEKLHTEFLSIQKKIHFILHEISHKKQEIHMLNKKIAMCAGLNVGPNTNTSFNEMAMTESNSTSGTSTLPPSPANERVQMKLAATAATLSSSTSASSASSSSTPTPPISASGSTSLSSSTATTSTSNNILLDPTSLPAMRNRAALLEKETKELIRWKSIARHLEQESKESARWKALGKAALAREKTLEQIVSNVNNHTTITSTTVSSDSNGSVGVPPIPVSAASKWRTRARAFEREMRELRAWKRAIDLQTVAAAGGGGPASPQGDFYAASNPTPLSNITYDDSDHTNNNNSSRGILSTDSDLLTASVVDGLPTSISSLAATLEADDDTSDPDRIEPQSLHMIHSAEEERLYAQKLVSARVATLTGVNGVNNNSMMLGANGLVGLDETNGASMQIDPNGGPVATHQRISAELMAAEAEEERLVQSMRLRSPRSGTPIQSSSQQIMQQQQQVVSNASSPSPSHASSPTLKGRRHSSAASLSPAGAASPSLTAINSNTVNPSVIGTSVIDGGISIDSPSGDDELLRLGEALVRRNGHLQQHRLMVRYQQQQMAIQMQAVQMARDMEQSYPQQQHNSTSHIQSMIHMQQQAQQTLQQQQQQSSHMTHAHTQPQEQMHNYSSKTGVLQASAPVFTPRFHSDTTLPLSDPIRSSVSNGSGVGHTVSGSKLASHYTKVSTANSSFASSLHTSPSLNSSPVNNSSPWMNSGSTSLGTVLTNGTNGTDHLDPSAYWLPPTLGGGTETTLDGSANASSRMRSLSNPPLPLHPSNVSSTLSSALGGSVLAGLSSDPFTAAFRRSANLTIIDDDNERDDALILNRIDNPTGIASPLSQYQSYGGYNGNNNNNVLSHSRVHSDESIGSASLLRSSTNNSGTGGQLPAFFSLTQGLTGTTSTSNSNSPGE